MVDSYGGKGKPSSKVVAEDVAAEIGLLMDTIRHEITNLLLEGVQRSASYCASLCAERIIAARRQIQRQFAENSENRGRQASNPKSSGKKAKTAAREPRTPLIRIPTPSPKRSPTRGQRQNESTQNRGAWEPVPPIPSVVRRSGQQKNPILESWIVSAETSEDDVVLPPFSTPSPSYDAAFIDTYDAVSALEERTAMAMEAMDRLDEVLKTPRPHSDSDRELSVSPSNAGTPCFGGQTKRAYFAELSATRTTGLPGRSSSTPVKSPVQPPPFGLASRSLGGSYGSTSVTASNRQPPMTARAGIR